MFTNISVFAVTNQFSEKKKLTIKTQTIDIIMKYFNRNTLNWPTTAKQKGGGVLC